MTIRTIALRGLNQTEQQFGDMLSTLNTWGQPLGLQLSDLHITSFDCYDAAATIAAMNATPSAHYLFLWGISFGGHSAIQATAGGPMGTNHPFPTAQRNANGVLLIDPVSKDHSGQAWTPGTFTSGTNALETLTVWRNPLPTEPFWSSPCETAAAPTFNCVQKGTHVDGQWNAVNSWPAILRVSQGKPLLLPPPPGDLYAVYNTHAATLAAIDNGSYNVIAVSLTNGAWYQINTAGQCWTLPGTNATQVTNPWLISQIKANAQPPLR